MTASSECKVQSAQCKMKQWLPTLCILTFALFTGTGCRQKMADQPYHRPYEASDMFEDGRSSRPLERGVIHRAQYLESDPLVTGLTREEWGRVYARQGNTKPNLAVPTPEVDREGAVTLPRFDQRDAAQPKVYAEEFPFEMKPRDLERGQERLHDLLCRLPRLARQRAGKIWERGYLNPTSFHTEIVGKHEIPVTNAPATPLGYSRGYSLWDIKMPLREAPAGYIFEVITKGYGGMPSYSAQIPAADRWRIVAYVRALQYSQHAPANTLPRISQSR